jgi:UDP-N-acetylmuramoylalanine-D-glutamate ligase
VAGIARAGQAAARALANRAGPANVAAWDASTSEPARDAAAELTAAGVRTSLGDDGVALLEAAPRPSCVVKSPGIPATHPLLEAAARRGLPVVDEAELGWRLEARPFVGVTGTNGKSTVCALVAAVLEGRGLEPVVAGNTTFGPPLSALDGVGGDVVVAELSSFQLAGSTDLLPEVAVFTNLADDHWEHHGGRAAYAAAKRRLFVRGERCAPLAIVNADDDEGAAIAARVEELGGATVGFGTRAPARVVVRESTWSLDAGSVTLTVDGAELEVATRFPGRHNAANVAAAVAVGVGLGIDPEQSAAAVARCPPVAGRWERLDAGQPCAVIVDYAHNPAGVRAALDTARGASRGDERPDGRLIVVSSALSVLGARQQRETGAALAGADELILSLERLAPDESRADPPAGLLDGVRAVGATATVIPDRRLAIRHAVGRARAGDTVLILNRGVRGTPILDGDDRPYRPDDREEARAAICATLA